MKARVKLAALGAAFAAVAVMAATQPDPAPSDRERRRSACYSSAEVDLLMRAHKWTRQEATIILEMACQFSHNGEQASNK